MGFASKFLKVAGGPISALIGVVVTSTILHEVGKDSGYKEGHRDGEHSGFENGYKKGNNDTKEKFIKEIEYSISKYCGIYALGLYIGDLDGNFDEEDQKAIMDVIGNPQLQQEYIQKELKEIFEKHPGFGEIKAKYLDKLKLEDLRKIDNYILQIIFYDGEVDNNESSFYNEQWEPYLLTRDNKTTGK